MAADGDDRVQGAYPCGPYEVRSRPNPYLLDAFGEVQAFWWQQSDCWYDILGRYVSGQYQLEDLPRDSSRLWNEWMGAYQRWLAFPYHRSQAGQVPSVAFVLDADAEGQVARELAVTGRFAPRTPLAATPLRASDGGALEGALIEAELVEGARFAVIRILDAGAVPPGEYRAVVYTAVSGGRSRAVALVHVVRAGEPVPRPAAARADTVNQLHREQRALLDRLDRTCERLEQHAATIDGRLADMQTRLADFETRLRRIEDQG